MLAYTWRAYHPLTCQGSANVVVICAGPQAHGGRSMQVQFAQRLNHNPIHHMRILTLTFYFFLLGVVVPFRGCLWAATITIRHRRSSQSTWQWALLVLWGLGVQTAFANACTRRQGSTLSRTQTRLGVPRANGALPACGRHMRIGRKSLECARTACTGCQPVCSPRCACRPCTRAPLVGCANVGP